MTLFRLWVSADGFYISQVQAGRMGFSKKEVIIRLIPDRSSMVVARALDLSEPMRYYIRVFTYRLYAVTTKNQEACLVEAIARGASLLLGTEKLQPYRYGEMSEDDGRRLEWEAQK